MIVYRVTVDSSNVCHPVIPKGVSVDRNISRLTVFVIGVVALYWGGGKKGK